MQKLFQLAVLAALVLGFSTPSQAALLLEPVVGYSFGDHTAEFSSGDSEEESVSGLSYGGRVGFQNMGFQLGLDYLASAMEVDGNGFDTSEWGAFVGFEFPILIRVYAGYIFAGSATSEGDDEDIKLKGGTGPKVGIGCTLLPFLDFNVEYRSVKYESKDMGLAEMDVDYNAIMVGFSLPFTI